MELPKNWLNGHDSTLPRKRVPFNDTQGTPRIGAVDVLVGTSGCSRRAPVSPRTWPCGRCGPRCCVHSPTSPCGEPCNYGVPFAFLLLTGVPQSWRALLQPCVPPGALGVDSAAVYDRVRRVLQATTALLLFGHGALGAFSARAFLARHYAAVDLPVNTIAIVGWTEIAMAVLVVLRASASLLFLVTAWKLASESM